ncbi:MAG TPA: GNAT family protein [Candidatus Paceibacterota bacterium]
MKNPFLTGETIYLRVIKEADLNENYREWFNDEEICRYNSHHRFPNYDQNMRSYYESIIKSGSNLVLAICDKKTDKHIGNIALENIDTLNQSAEFAVLIGDKTHWGKGVGAEAGKLIIQHGFEELNLHRIQCGTQDDNIAMQKLAARLGFKKEGRMRESVWKSGKFKDHIYYGLLRHEFKA